MIINYELNDLFFDIKTTADICDQINLRKKENIFECISLTDTFEQFDGY